MSYSYDKCPRSVNWLIAGSTGRRTLQGVDVLDRLRMDVPVAQAGMGGGLAGPDLAIAVAQAGGLGTLGWAPAAWLRKSLRRVRDAEGRPTSVGQSADSVRWSPRRRGVRRVTNRRRGHRVRWGSKPGG